MNNQNLDTLRPRQNGRHFSDNIFKCIFLNENVRISIKISLKFVPKALINNIPALVQIMAWRRQGDKPLSEPMMVRLPTHICVTRPQWVNSQKTSHILPWQASYVISVMRIWEMGLNILCQTKPGSLTSNSDQMRLRYSKNSLYKFISRFPSM